MAAKKKPATKTSTASKTSAAKTEPVKETEAKAEPVKETAAKAVDTAKTETKTETVKAENQETKAAAEKTAAKKETKAAATAAPKKTAKKTEITQEVYVEYGDQQIYTDEIVNRIKEKYVGEGHYLASIKSLKVYLKLEERKAYYVINDKAEENQFVEF